MLDFRKELYTLFTLYFNLFKLSSKLDILLIGNVVFTSVQFRSGSTVIGLVWKTSMPREHVYTKDPGMFTPCYPYGWLQRT